MPRPSLTRTNAAAGRRMRRPYEEPSIRRKHSLDEANTAPADLEEHNSLAPRPPPGRPRRPGREIRPPRIEHGETRHGHAQPSRMRHRHQALLAQYIDPV